MDSESGVQSGSPATPGSEPEFLVGKKRVLLEGEGACGSSQKRIRLDDLESVRDEEETGDHPDVSSVSGALDLNVTARSISISAPSGFEVVKTREFAMDLNADSVSSLINDPFHRNKAYEHLKLRDESECGSSVGSLDEKSSMNVWEGLKQNNYMSAHGVPAANAIPKARGRKKSSNDMIRRVELAKKEQADRFAKVAAPSGLLNELNPGIINHVRNRKQVHAIIEALVRSEKTENEQSGSQRRNPSRTWEPIERGDLHNSLVNRSGMSFGNDMLERGQLGVQTESSYLKSEFPGGYDHSYMGMTRFSEKMSGSRNFGDKVAVASENTSCWSNEEPRDLTNVVDSLSVKAAKVASQWLGLLNQDIRGRLAALKRSKKRVRSVITKELPSMMLSREFSPNSAFGCHTDNAAKWGTLFQDMDKALSDEEIHLEAWLKQVNEMQRHCDNGLNKSNMHRGPLDTALLQSCNRSNEAHDSEEDLAIMAAAASIYSTCNYSSSSVDNLPCC